MSQTFEEGYLPQVVFSELEEADAADALLLAEDFPFEAGPPTMVGQSHSPGLGRLVDAIEDCRDALSTAEHNSLVKVLIIASLRGRSSLTWCRRLITAAGACASLLDVRCTDTYGIVNSIVHDCVVMRCNLVRGMNIAHVHCSAARRYAVRSCAQGVVEGSAC